MPMKSIRGCAAMLVCLLAVSACHRKAPVVPDVDVVARVGERALLRTEVEAMMSQSTAQDSLIGVEGFIKKWVKDVLMYQMARQNIGEDKAEIDRLVEDYRHALTRYRYQEHLVREKLVVDIRESEKRLYYENNKKEFILDRHLVRGLYLKIPKDAPGLEDIRRAFHSKPEAAVEMIEKYSVQNAVTYDYFYDRWVEFEEVIHNIPVRLPDTPDLLQRNRPLEANDDNFCYLLHISESLMPGDLAPYEFVSADIVEILVNQRKMTFLRQFEEDIYSSAIRSGRAVIHPMP
jgi:hypothetical protein